MRVRGRRRISVLLAVVLAAPLMLPAAAGAQSGGAFLDGAEPWTESDCAGDVPIVVGSDAAAQSDIYSAVTLAGVVGTDCVVLAGSRGGAMPAVQQARLDAAAAGGYVVGGAAAVPDAKLAGRDMTRLGGASRWATAQIIGNEARYLADGTRPDSPSMTETAANVSADVQQPGVYLDGAEPWIASDCAGDVPIVVGSDAAAQSDIYSAVTLAGVVGTDCVILAGPRDGAMPASQQARLNAAADGGFVLGGIAAVPTAKLAGRDMTRLGGAIRWETAQLVGRRASGDTTAGTNTSIEPSGGEPEETGTEEEETVPNPVQPSPDWFAAYREIEDFGGGTWTLEDQQTLADMYSAHIGNGCVFDVRRGICQGSLGAQTRALEALRGCPRGWSLSYVNAAPEVLCFHPLHEDYLQRNAYHDPSEASTEVVYPPY